MDLLFPPTRQRVLAALLLKSRGEHLRELARQTGTHAGTLARELDKLTQAGLLLRAEQGNQVRYQANASHPLFPELSAMFRKTHGMVPALRSALAPLDDRIDFALIFGSVAAGTATEGSDVDLLVLGDAPFRKLVTALHPLQAGLGKEINGVLYKPEEFAERYRRKDAFARQIVEKPKIWLKGTADDLAKLVGHQAAAGTRR